MRKRLIPVLLLTEDGLVKTKKFKGGAYIGDPINTVKLFNDMEVDEIIILDIEARRKKRDPQFSLIKEIAAEAFMPLCYGGGIKDHQQAHRLFYSGIEKVSLNTLLFEDPQMVSSMTEVFGSQSIVASLDIAKDLLGRYKLFNCKKRRKTQIDFHQAVRTATQLGVGEILLNFVDRDGMMNGIESKALKNVCRSVDIPVVYCGGIGGLDDIKAAFDSGANAVAAGSFFVYKGKGEGVLVNYPKRDHF